MSSMADALVVADEHGKVSARECSLPGHVRGAGQCTYRELEFRSAFTAMKPPAREQGRVDCPRHPREKFDAFEFAVRRTARPRSCTHGERRADPRRARPQIGAVMVYRNVTEARQIERQLRQSQKLDAIGQLTARRARLQQHPDVITARSTSCPTADRIVRRSPRSQK